MSVPPPTGSFSLFPNTNRPPSRSQPNRPRAPTPPGGVTSPVLHDDDEPVVGAAVTAEVRIERPAPVADVAWRGNSNSNSNTQGHAARESSTRSRSSIAKVRLSLYDEAVPPDQQQPPPMPGLTDYQQYQQYWQQQPQQQQPPPPPPQALDQQPPSQRPPPLRSIFPQYNPEVPLDQQDYYPTQTSPGRIPRAVISRPLYSPGEPEPEAEAEPEPEQPQQRSPPRLTVHTGMPSAVSHVPAVVPPSTVAPDVRRQQQQQQQQQQAAQTWPPVRGVPGVSREPPRLPVPSTSEELRSFWKVANGWKAGTAEGQVYCMSMTVDKDSPVYRLSSASQQPFYRLRLDPTSMSAYVTLARHDPSRAFKAGGGDGDGGDSRGAAPDDLRGSDVHGGSSTPLSPSAQAHARYDSSKHWQVALTTTLEEEARRRPPGDGLVALLYPQQAARMALEHPQDAATVATAERECARLVWDDDSAHYFVVHPALALPFCVTIEHSATWSRTAYTLEHLESPQHLARLTRDGTGAGYLEIDTAIAAKIDAVYLVDVAVAALVLVAHADGQFTHVEQFAAPPPAVAGGGEGGAADASPRASLVNLVMGRSSSRQSGRAAERSRSKASKAVRTSVHQSVHQSVHHQHHHHRMEEFDIESQTSLDLANGKALEHGGGLRPPLGLGGLGLSPQQRRRRQRDRDRRKSKADDDKMPGCLRLVAFVLKAGFWCVAMCVRAMLAVVSGLFRCLTGEKLL